MKFIDMFSGIGGFRMGFELAGHECVGHIEFDKFAQKSYEAIYSVGREEEYAKEFNGWDITKIKGADLPQADIWTFGAPCQDFSIAGKREGLKGNRSNLVQEVFRLYRETSEENRPRYLIYENVKGMFSSNGGRDFLSILSEMESLGFSIEWQLLNSKNFGVPQNRERVYLIAHFGGFGGREVFPIEREDGQIIEETIKIVGSTAPPTAKGTNSRQLVHDPDGIVGALGAGDYKQPKQIVVDNEIKCLTNYKKNAESKGFESNDRVYDQSGVSPTLTARDYKDPTKVLVDSEVKQIGNIDQHCRKRKNPHTGRVYDPEGLSPCLTSMQGGGLEPKVLVDEPLIGEIQPVDREYKSKGNKRDVHIEFQKENIAPCLMSGVQKTRLVYKDNPLENKNEDAVTDPKLKKVGNVYPSGGQNGNVYSAEGICPTISSGETSTKGNGGVGSSNAPKVLNNFRIRKLTPKECWRLQGFPDWAFERAEAVNSNSQLYKQAGNGVTVNVTYVIGKLLQP